MNWKSVNGFIAVKQIQEGTGYVLTEGIQATLTCEVIAGTDKFPTGSKVIVPKNVERGVIEGCLIIREEDIYLIEKL